MQKRNRTLLYFFTTTLKIQRTSHLLTQEMAEGAMSSHLYSTPTQYLIECYRIDQPRTTNGN